MSFRAGAGLAEAVAGPRGSLMLRTRPYRAYPLAQSERMRNGAPCDTRQRCHKYRRDSSTKSGIMPTSELCRVVSRSFSEGEVSGAQWRHNSKGVGLAPDPST